MKKKAQQSLALIALMTILGCQNEKKEIDTPIKGTINVLVDECYKPLIDSEKMIFESHYPNAHIHLHFRPGLDVIEGIDNDSFRVLISSLAPDSITMEQFYEKNKFRAKTSAIGKDGVAIISHNSRKDMQITREELAQILSGKITDFSQLQHPKGSGAITLVFDHPRSSTVVYMQDSILKGDSLRAKAYAKQSNEEVIQYVSKNPNALGIIGVSWISDEADENAQKFREDVSLVSIGNQGDPYYYLPQMGYIAIHKYPLRRLMLVTVKEGGARLGTGFTNFLTGEYGQKIILRAGLVPATVPTRVVVVK